MCFWGVKRQEGSSKKINHTVSLCLELLVPFMKMESFCDMSVRLAVHISALEERRW